MQHLHKATYMLDRAYGNSRFWKRVVSFSLFMHSNKYAQKQWNGFGLQNI